MNQKESKHRNSNISAGEGRKTGLKRNCPRATFFSENSAERACDNRVREREGGRERVQYSVMRPLCRSDNDAAQLPKKFFSILPSFLHSLPRLPALLSFQRKVFFSVPFRPSFLQVGSESWAPGCVIPFPDFLSLCRLLSPLPHRSCSPALLSL